jgi:hypothetical protein
MFALLSLEAFARVVFSRQIYLCQLASAAQFHLDSDSELERLPCLALAWCSSSVEGFFVFVVNGSGASASQ